MATKPAFVSTGSNPNTRGARPKGIVSTGDSPPGGAVVPTYYERHHPDYTMQEIMWKRMEDLYLGEDRVKEMGALYLPPTEVELDESGNGFTDAGTRYTARLRSAIFFNGVDRLTKYTMGHLYRMAPKVSDLPPELKPILVNADLNGTPLEIFLKNLSILAYVKGHYHAMVDMPDTRGVITSRAQERALNPYPYFVMVDPSEIIDWSAQKSPNGKIRFNWIVRKETTYESSDPGVPHNRVTRFRIWYPDRWELYEHTQQQVIEPGDQTTTDRLSPQAKQNRITAMLIDQGRNPLGVVPLITVYSQMLRPMVSKPPLDEAGHLNIHHYQMYSAFMNGLYYHLAPILHLSGVTSTDRLKIGAKSAIITPRSGDAKYIETQGHGLDIARKSCDELAQEMWESGMRSATFMGANASGDARRVSRSDFISWMNSVANFHEIAFHQMFQMAALWKGLKPFGDEADNRVVKLNRDYDLNTLDANGKEFLLNARKAGEISRKTFLSELVRGEALSADINVDEEVASAKKDLNADVKVIAKLQGGGTPAKPLPADGGGPQPPNPPSQ